jgi:hypothetical protein
MASANRVLGFLGVLALTGAAVACGPKAATADRAGWPIVIGECGGPQFCTPKELAVDSHGNVYLLGLLSGEVDFDPGEGVQSCSSDYQTLRSFVAKYNHDGGYEWHRCLDRYEEGLFFDDLACDEDGNLYAVGWRRPTSQSHDSGEDQDATGVLMKLDPAGETIWELELKSPASTSGGCYEKAIVVCCSDAVFYGGLYYGDVDFDPGVGVQIRSSNGARDVFLCRFTPSGELQWVRAWGTQGRSEFPWDVAADDAGHAYASGAFSRWDNLIFDTGLVVSPETAGLPSGSYLVKMNDSGGVAWVKTWGGTEVNDHCISRRVAVSQSGKVYVLGNFAGGFQIRKGNGVLSFTSNGFDDVFLAAFDSLGATQWVHTWGGAQGDSPRCLYLDPIGRIYCTGSFEVPIDFDPGTATTNKSETFLSVFGPDGDFDRVEIGVGAGISATHDTDLYVCVYEPGDTSPIGHYGAINDDLHKCRRCLIYHTEFE